MPIETNCLGVLMAGLPRVTGRYKKVHEDKAMSEHSQLLKGKDASFLLRKRD